MTQGPEISDNARLWLRLRHTEGMTRARLAALSEAFGSAADILAATAKEIAEVADADSSFARAIHDVRLTLELDEEIQKIQRFGVRLITRDDDDYPANLLTMPAAPPLLYVMGQLSETDRYAVTIVGTRRSTGYGRTLAADIAATLGEAGITVISGLARGIDTAAHEGALQAGGRTLAVTANGLSAVYPVENEQLAWRISHGPDGAPAPGALMTEYAMDSRPERFHFPERNQILAGLALATVVVEAPEKSGALLTARSAVDIGREVCAVPGDITRAASRGANALLREGATLIRSGADLLEDLTPLMEDYLADRRQQRPEASMRTIEDMSFEEAQVYEIAREEPAHFDLLFDKARRQGADIDPSQLSIILMKLEMKRLIKQSPGKLFVAEEPAGYRRADPESDPRQVT